MKFIPWSDAVELLCSVHQIKLWIIVEHQIPRKISWGWIIWTPPRRYFLFHTGSEVPSQLHPCQKCIRRIVKALPHVRIWVCFFLISYHKIAIVQELCHWILCLFFYCLLTKLNHRIILSEFKISCPGECLRCLRNR